MKKIITIAFSLVMVMMILTGCNQQQSSSNQNTNNNPPNNNQNNQPNEPPTNPEPNEDESLRQMILGTWEHTRWHMNDGTPQTNFENVVTYYADGTEEVDGEYYGHWAIENGELITTNPSGESTTWALEFYADGHGLILVAYPGNPNGTTHYYEKK